MTLILTQRDCKWEMWISNTGMCCMLQVQLLQYLCLILEHLPAVEKQVKLPC